MNSAVKATNTFPVSVEFGFALLAIPQASSHKPHIMAPVIMIVLLPNSLFMEKRPRCTPMNPMQEFMMLYSNAFVIPAMVKKYVWYPMKNQTPLADWLAIVPQQSNVRLKSFPRKRSRNPELWLSLRSSATPRIISAHSSSNSSPWSKRRRSKDLRAASCWSWCKSHRGLSGTKKSAVPSRTGTMNMQARGI